MGKHILEGRYFPFTCAGQAYTCRRGVGSALAAMAFRTLRRQCHFVEELHRSAVVVGWSFSVFIGRSLALYDGRHNCFCGYDCVSQSPCRCSSSGSLPSQRLFLAASFHSPANDYSLLIDSIDAESKVATISSCSALLPG